MQLSPEQLIPQLVIYMVVLLLAISAHEAAHAWMSYKFGDDTARLLGRITLNPAAHTDPIGTLLADRRNLHHNAAQYLALPNVGLHRFHRGRGPSWPADPGLRGDCRTRRCSNGVVTPRWRMVFSLAPWRAAASRACCSLRARQ